VDVLDVARRVPNHGGERPARELDQCLQLLTRLARPARVLSLPASERAELAQKLLQSLEPESSPEVQQAWADELVRRARELEAGTVKAIPWPDA
jgi:putative addiction module component (TIGR02574 family)